MLRIISIFCIGYALAVPLGKQEAELYPEENPDLFEGDIELRPGQDPRDRNAQRNRNYRWPNGVVPFVIQTSQFSSTEVNTIKQAMKTIEDKTKVNGKPCITFVPRTNQAAYVRYQSGSGCHTPVGYHHSVSGITLGPGCGRIGTAEHETMHALGFWHEQSRPDRDSWVTIEWSNIQKGREHNFDKYTTSQVDTLNIQYDYESVMHYNAYSFAVDRTKPTIVVKQRGAVIGQRTHLSPSDIKEIQLYYGCTASSGGTITTPAPATQSPQVDSINISRETHSVIQAEECSGMDDHSRPYQSSFRSVYAAETCTFEKDMCKWTNPGGDNTNWIRRHGGTPSAGTGPLTDHSGSSSGYYLYVEASGHFNQKAYLLSQSFPPGYYCFSIYYHMYGQDEGSLKVEVLAGNTRRIIHTVSGNQGNTWHHYLLNLHVTNGNFQIEIEGDTGRSYRSDIAIDDLTVHNGQCTSSMGKRDVEADFFEI